MNAPPITNGDTAATLAGVEAHRRDRRDTAELARLAIDVDGIPSTVHVANPFDGLTARAIADLTRIDPRGHVRVVGT